MSAFVADALARIEQALGAGDLPELLRWGTWDPYDEPVDEPDFDELVASWTVQRAAKKALAGLSTRSLARSLLDTRVEVQGVLQHAQGASWDLIGQALLLREGKSTATDLAGMLSSDEDHEAAARAIDAVTMVFSGRVVFAVRRKEVLPLPPLLEALADLPLEGRDSYSRARLAWVRKELDRLR